MYGDGRCSIITNITYMVYARQSCVEHPKAARQEAVKRSYVTALTMAFQRYPDTHLKMLIQGEENLVCVLATKNFAKGELIIVPCSTMIKSRIIKYGQQTSFLETQLSELENGDIMVCSPCGSQLTRNTVIAARLDRFVCGDLPSFLLPSIPPSLPHSLPHALTFSHPITNLLNRAPTHTTIQTTIHPPTHSPSHPEFPAPTKPLCSPTHCSHPSNHSPKLHNHYRGISQWGGS